MTTLEKAKKCFQRKPATPKFYGWKVLFGSIILFTIIFIPFCVPTYWVINDVATSLLVVLFTSIYGLFTLFAFMVSYKNPGMLYFKWILRLCKLKEYSDAYSAWYDEFLWYQMVLETEAILEENDKKLKS